jgi:hypothetical protein
MFIEYMTVAKAVSAVITANKGKGNALANKIKQVEPVGDT